MQQTTSAETQTDGTLISVVFVWIFLLYSISPVHFSFFGSVYLITLTVLKEKKNSIFVYIHMGLLTIPRLIPQLNLHMFEIGRKERRAGRRGEWVLKVWWVKSIRYTSFHLEFIYSTQHNLFLLYHMHFFFLLSFNILWITAFFCYVIS